MCRVLLLDDDDLLLRTLQRGLVARGLDVVTAPRADGALAAVAAGDIDVVVSDIRMPGTSGLDFLREVRRQNVDVPVVLMTGVPELDTAITAVELGAVHYLQKPFRIEALDAIIARAVLSRRRHGVDEGLVGDVETLGARFAAALDALWPAFQPIVSMRARGVVAYEALLRTREPSLSNPVAFVTAAEHTRRLNDLGTAIRRAIARRMERAPDGVDVYVNLHPHDLLDPSLFDPVAPLSRHASRVVLEITERAGLESIDDVCARIASLRALGYRVAVDDLGAGYAGLASVASFAPDIIKVDMSLVRGISDDARRQRMVAALASMCSDLSTTIVVEGVETRAERDVVSDLGADLMQGYLFARPEEAFVPVDARAFD